MKNIVLCGFMGCGKSTVGKQLAAKTDRTFVDMDAYIEQQAGKSVNEIFTESGESVFREMEHAACRTLGSQSDLVIATGGGAVLRSDNVTALRQNGTIVLLEVTAEDVLVRLQKDTTRPLLQRDDKETAIKELLAARTPLYRQAADRIVNGTGDIEAVVNAVLQTIF